MLLGIRITLQGDHASGLVEILVGMGYTNTKKSGGGKWVHVNKYPQIQPECPPFLLTDIPTYGWTIDVNRLANISCDFVYIRLLMILCKYETQLLCVRVNDDPHFRSLCLSPFERQLATLQLLDPAAHGFWGRMSLFAPVFRTVLCPHSLHAVCTPTRRYHMY